jgi:hypothetical protein
VKPEETTFSWWALPAEALRLLTTLALAFALLA